MLSINKSDITEIEYTIEAEGISVSEISEVRLSVIADVIYSFLGKIEGSKLVFRINPSLFECKEYQFRIEIITNYYYFNILDDKLIITEPNIKVKLINTPTTKINESKTVKPVVRLKL